MNKGLAIAGVGAALAGVILLMNKGAGAYTEGEEACFLARADQWYYVTWTGASKYLPDAFGPGAWSAIGAVEMKVEGNWEAPGDPNNHVLYDGDQFRFQVAEDVDVCL